MQNTKKRSFDLQNIVIDGITIEMKSCEDMYVFAQSLLEAINQIIQLSDVIDIPQEDVNTTIRSIVRVLQSIDLEH